jgi:uncharacterized protein YcaQ
MSDQSLTLTRSEARRFVLAHHHLWPPRRLEGKAGILEYVRHVGSVQFDPINVVGRNPDLVLQSRVCDYAPELLEELLYTDRVLLDGWDKMASIIPASDWPYFARHRDRVAARHADASNPAVATAPQVLAAIRERGPLSSIDMKESATIQWSWGQNSRLSRAALEILYATGRVGVHHRVGTRRVFDLIERLLPEELLAAPDPNESERAYQDWHVLRRIGGIGMASARGGDHWLAIQGVKAPERRASLERLVARGSVLAVAVEGFPRQTHYIRAADAPTLEAVRQDPDPAPEAALIGALDNLIWDRELVRRLFDFDYKWEVYTPVRKRRYGYYVLPVLHGERFVARCEPVFDQKAHTLTIRNWWWEKDVVIGRAMIAGLAKCMRSFGGFLGAKRVLVGEAIAEDENVRQMADSI